MTLVRARITHSYDPQAPHQTIEDYLTDMANGCDQNDIGGYFVVGEGNSWILLEGEDSDVETMITSIENESFTSDVVVNRTSPIDSVALDKTYLYHETDKPITSS